MNFPNDFFIGAATAAHQVEGNNIHSDYWAQEQMPHDLRYICTINEANMGLQLAAISATIL